MHKHLRTIAIPLAMTVLTACATTQQRSPSATPITLNGTKFPSEEAALDSIRANATRQLDAITPMSPRIGGSVVIVLPDHDALVTLISARGPTLNGMAAGFLADLSLLADEMDAQAVGRSKLFDSVTIVHAKSPAEQPGAGYAYRLWANIEIGNTIRWYLARGTGTGVPFPIVTAPGNTTQLLARFNAMVVNAAADLGVAIPRLPLPGVGATSATGFFVNAEGDMLTNAHAVNGCKTIQVTLSAGDQRAATLLAKDTANDLAVVQVPGRTGAVATFRTSAPVRQGEDIVVYGYPLAGVLSSQGNLTTGIVSSLAGLMNDSRQLQISAPIQPGDSGGPVFDTSGNVVAIASGKLNALGVAAVTKDIAQNVNFGIKAEIALNFLTANGVHYTGAASKAAMHTEDIGDRARSFTNMVQCLR